MMKEHHHFIDQFISDVIGVITEERADVDPYEVTEDILLLMTRKLITVVSAGEIWQYI